MKTICTTLCVALAALGAAPDCRAQETSQKADSLLLSEQIDGDYQVRHYLVHEADAADYAVHYRINNATLNQSLENNAATLRQLDSLADRVLPDTLNKVRQITIIGYASPDGPLALNKRLSERRAADMKAYADKQYHFSKRYPVQCKAEVASWASLHDAVAASSIPHRDSVLKILHGNHTEAQKEAALKRIPEVWHYLAVQLLPPVRRATVDVAYQRGAVVETRRMLPKPKVAETPQPAPTPEVVVVEEIIERKADPCCDDFCNSEQLGVIVDMTGVEIDY